MSNDDALSDTYKKLRALVRKLEDKQLSDERMGLLSVLRKRALQLAMDDTARPPFQSIYRPPLPTLPTFETPIADCISFTTFNLGYDMRLLQGSAASFTITLTVSHDGGDSNDYVDYLKRIQPWL